jgi:hypothetical protein
MPRRKTERALAAAIPAFLYTTGFSGSRFHGVGGDRALGVAAGAPVVGGDRSPEAYRRPRLAGMQVQVRVRLDPVAGTLLYKAF